MTPTGSNLGIGIAYAIPLPSLTGGPGPAPKWEAFDGDLHGNGAKRTEVERAHAASKTLTVLVVGGHRVPELTPCRRRPSRRPQTPRAPATGGGPSRHACAMPSKRQASAQPQIKTSSET